eukprot:COSAG06_NODE_1124_length_10620_cov_48.182587_9_plen_49_part_00
MPGSHRQCRLARAGQDGYDMATITRLLEMMQSWKRAGRIRYCASIVNR